MTVTGLLVFHSSYQLTGDYLLDFSPTSSRVVRASSLLCQELELSISPVGHTGYNGTLSLLSSPPELTGSERFSGKYVVTSTNRTQYVHFYMYPGSRFNMTVCNTGPSPLRAVFSLVKGSDPDTGKVVDEFEITESSNCHVPGFSYSVESEGYYFMVFKVKPPSFAQPRSSLSVYMEFECTNYQHPPNSVLASCSVENSHRNDSCRLSYPMSARRGGGVPFLDIRPLSTEAADWLDQRDVRVDIRCVTRGWAYLLIGTCVMSVAVLVFGGVMGACACLLRRRKKRLTGVYDTDADDRTPLVH